MYSILVTGGTGFLGSHLVRNLVQGGHKVRVLSRAPERAKETVPANVEIMSGDIVDAVSCTQAVAGCDVVFHLAAAYQEPGITKDQYRRVHVTGTKNLVQSAHTEGVTRFVHCSTVGVQGDIRNPPARETEPHDPGDIYQQTKAEAEDLALEFGATHGLAVTVARPTAIYGPGDMRLLKLFKMIRSKRFIVLGSGEIYYHMIYVDDLVRGLRLLSVHPAASGQVFTLGGDRYCTLNELTACIADELRVPPPRLRLPSWPFQLAGSVVERICIPLGVTPPIYRRRVDFFTKSRAFSVEKAKRTLGFEAKVPLSQGLRATIEWYQAQGHLPEPAATAARETVTQSVAVRSEILPPVHALRPHDE